MFACKTNTTTLTGKIEDMTDGTEVRLIPGATHMQEEPVAEVVVANGTFKLTVTVEEPRLFYLQFLSPDSVRNFMSVMVAPGDKVTIAGTFADPIVTGSEMHDMYAEKFIKPRAEMNARKTAIDQKYADISRRLREASRNRDTAEVARIRAGEEWKAYEREDDEFFRSIGPIVDKVVEENANTFWGPLLLLSHTTFLTPENERHYKMFSEEARYSFYGKAMALSLFGIPIGERAPEFTAKDVHGNEHSLQSLLKGDNYILLDFWATWCGPCIRFMPKLKELAEKYADKGLVVVAISTDKDKDVWQKFLEREPKPWLNLLDESNISKDFGVSGIPSLYLLDPQGRIVFGKQSGQSVADKLAEVFGK
jgi:thiol-disulfide isomerase/thioredoxin